MRRTWRKRSNSERRRIAERRAKRLEVALKAERNKPLPPDPFPNVRAIQIWLDRLNDFRGDVYGINVRLDVRAIGMAMLRSEADRFLNISQRAEMVAYDIGRQIRNVIVESVQKDFPQHNYH